MDRALNNKRIAEILRSVAAAYEAKGEDRFRIVAYQKAADAIEYGTYELRGLWEKGRLQDVSGIGPNLASHLDELFKTGHVKHFDEVLRDLPEAMFPLMDIAGIGAKSAYKLATELKLKRRETAIKDLKGAAERGLIRKIEGFGEESEKDILKAIGEIEQRTKRMVLPQATEIAENLLSWLYKSPEVIKATPLGSLRRQVETVGDIDIAVATDKPEAVIRHFTSYPTKSEIIEAGKATASILLESGVQIDLMVQPSSAYGALLQHFTGSKQHNIHLRDLALRKGLSLSEYGIKEKDKIRQFESEEQFYNALGFSWIPPEIREDKGELEAALANKLPQLVSLGDIKGDLHIHSNFKIETSHDEGANSVEEILDKANNLGYEYVAFTEHNPSISHHSNSQTIELLKRKKELIESINYSHEKVFRERGHKLLTRGFNSLEVDIRPDGILAVPEEGLRLLDFAIVSIHSSFRLEKKEMTKRLLAALEHPKVKILGHPTGRKLLTREGVELDWEAVFDFCLKHGKWLEINSWPERLDLPDDLVFEAVKRGVKMVINTDSHEISQLNLMRFGVSVARRGWAEKKDIVNTLGYNEFTKLLR